MLNSETKLMDKKDLFTKEIKSNACILKKNEKINGDKDCYNIKTKENGFQKDSTISDNDAPDKNLKTKEPSLIDEKNNKFNKDINDKKLIPLTNFFNCNENYFKERMLNTNNFRLKSKNYKEKIIFNNNTKIEDIEPNKINNILRDIYLFQNNLNKNNSRLGKDINFMRNEEQDINKSLNVYINNNEFGCKYNILIFLIIYS